LSPRAADRPADPRALLPQLLRRIPGPGLPPPARLARLEQEEILPGVSLLPRCLLSPRLSNSDRHWPSGIKISFHAATTVGACAVPSSGVVHPSTRAMR